MMAFEPENINKEGSDELFYYPEKEQQKRLVH